MDPAHGPARAEYRNAGLRRTVANSWYLNYLDEVARIPMHGMVQSLNLSVSVAVVLYEAYRQRAARGYYDAPRLPAAEYERLYRKWLAIES